MGIWVKLLLALLLVVCGGLPSQANQKIIVAGTGDSQKLLNALARGFEENRPGVKIEVPPSVGSTGGIKHLLDGDCELARIARPLAAEEQGHGLKYRVFAFSPVVFTANLQRPCPVSLSAEQVVGIYSGKISSWSQLGACPEHKIYVANREEGDSSRRIIEQRLTGFKDISSWAGEILYSTPATLETVEKHPFTFGYLPLSSALNTSLVKFQFEGVEPTVENVQDRSYPLSVPLGIAWKEPLTGLAREFAEYLFSPQAHAIMQSSGAVPAHALPDSIAAGSSIAEHLVAGCRCCSFSPTPVLSLGQ